MRGPVLVPGDAGYDEARAVWNGMIDRKPAVIARCTGATDVMASVNFARDHGFKPSVRGGAHSVAGFAVGDGTVMIDLSLMKGIWVDPKAKRARAQGGVLWNELDRETQAFGLATTGGTVSNTGIGGLTLGGGLGWLMARHGLTCDNVVSADVVTADGKLLTTSDDENQDLFWAVRGGSGNFGVVTSFEYQLHPVDMVLGGMLVYPRPQAREVLRFYRDLCETCPDELTVFAGLMTSPEGDPIVGLLAGYFGPIEEGEKAMKPLREFGPPVADMIQPMPYGALQSMLDPAAAEHGWRRYWKSGFIPELTDEFIDTAVEQAEDTPSPLSAVLLFHVHGEAARVPSDATAFSMRKPIWDFDIVAQWTDPNEDEQQVAWTRRYWSAVEPFAASDVYINHIAGDEPERVRPAFGSNFQRLQEMKKKYDPANLFSLNPNIRPD